MGRNGISLNPSRLRPLCMPAADVGDFEEEVKMEAPAESEIPLKSPLPFYFTAGDRGSPSHYTKGPD